METNPYLLQEEEEQEVCEDNYYTAVNTEAKKFMMTRMKWLLQ